MTTVQRLSRFVVAVAASLALPACAIDNHRESPSGVQLIAQYFAALNRRDLLALTLYVSPDFEWYSTVGGERTLEVSSHEALKTMLTRYFDQAARAHWTLLKAFSNGSSIATVERSQWSDGKVMQSRENIGVYEIDAGRIRRVTYFLNER